MDYAIETTALTKRFGKQIAVNDVDLKVPNGAIFGFLGSNGAGKSTSVRMILGLSRPTSGQIRLFGEKLQHKKRPLIGAMADSPGGAFYDHLSARDNLRVVATSLGITENVDALLETVGLSHAASKKVRAFSTGMRQRLGIARALIGSPPLVILDEPLNGLDPEGIREMRQLIRTLAEGRTLIICSHLLGEIELVASHIALLSEGRLVHQGPLADLATGPPKLDIEARGDQVAALLKAMSTEIEQIEGDRYRLTLGNHDPAAINRKLVESGAEVSALTPYRFSLEEFYHHQIGSAHHG
ncbi:ATP-binding cassette domain-containing protein [Sphingomicrobium sediminis]|uniref:ATP-binding cassette domain-containing protein n=1 Tax=Sphingomicrobium sediminis TaxID=2950949 RepID=A0A9X2EK84_9SPHN|nr:ATP-binding cassette domain-containing protein [Sphingomicrobium sediminis]MCM8556862.1 ATP-binding cassette domain-containing protein [Sphingomicrobium sediminis]